MRYLIFGSNGFIGSHLSRTLIDDGHEVVAVSNSNNAACSDVTSHFRYQDNQDFIDKILDNKIDICINCAGAASVPNSFSDPFKDYELNTRIVFRLLSAINKLKNKSKFINLSSAAVYGNPQRIPIRISQVPNPISPYGNHKYMSEMICKQFADFFGIDTCSLRIFSAYGIGLKKQLFWDLHNKAKVASSAIKLYGTGKESRDFIYISDLVEAISIISRQSQFSQSIYNIANGEEVLIEDAVRGFYDSYSKKIVFAFSGEGRKGDPINWKADISGLLDLGYKPKISMNEGLELYANWVEQQ